MMLPLSAVLIIVLEVTKIVAGGPSVRIINGQNAALGEFPFMVSIWLNGAHHCGGSLIAEDLVITTAHSINLNNLPEYLVKAGLVSQKDNSTNVQESKVVAAYDRGEDYDVCLLKLETHFKRTKYVDVINYPNAKDDYTGHKVNILGWGMTEEGEFPDILKKATVDIVSSAKCDVPNTHTICALDVENEKSSGCFQDSGGPVVVPFSNKSPAYILVGIIMGGYCGETSVPFYLESFPKVVDWVRNKSEEF